MCIKLVIKTNLYYDARSEKHQNIVINLLTITTDHLTIHTINKKNFQRDPTGR
jgi:hypothetical protein